MLLVLGCLWSTKEEARFEAVEIKIVEGKPCCGGPMWLFGKDDRVTMEGKFRG